jgi:CheY-like chemotaxis protein
MVSLMSEKSARPLVLLVEDDDKLSRLRARSLEKMGLDVVVSTTLTDALAVLEEAPALDAVLTDIKLSSEPGDKGGVELAKAARKRFKDIPIVGYSAFYSNEILDEISPFFDRYFSKGSTPIAGIEEAHQEIYRAARDAHERRTK